LFSNGNDLQQQQKQQQEVKLLDSMQVLKKADSYQSRDSHKGDNINLSRLNSSPMIATSKELLE